MELFTYGLVKMIISQMKGTMAKIDKINHTMTELYIKFCEIHKEYGEVEAKIEDLTETMTFLASKHKEIMEIFNDSSYGSEQYDWCVHVSDEIDKRADSLNEVYAFYKQKMLDNRERYSECRDLLKKEIDARNALCGELRYWKAVLEELI